MSGGDGKGHNSGAHDSGGSINGTSGKGGPVKCQKNIEPYRKLPAL